MRKETTDLLGFPVPEALFALAKRIDEAIEKAVSQVPEVSKARLEVTLMKRRLSEMQDEKADEMFLHPRNIGSHFYPGIVNGDFKQTTDCNYCNCWMGGSRSGGPEGVDPFGACPGNPKLRDAYELLKSKLSTAEVKLAELKKHLETTIEMKTN